jgi:hypothetical protein
VRPRSPLQQSYGAIANCRFCLHCENYFFNYYILLESPAYKATETLLLPFTFFIFQVMGNLLYISAVILIIIWALGFFGVLGPGIGGNNLIHILLVIAIIAILLRVISGRSAV